MQLLKFSEGKQNSKLAKLETLTGRKVYTFSTLSGKNCFGARDCLAWVEEQPDGKKKIVNGSEQKFRCFSASLEIAFPAVYNQRKYNTELVAETQKLADLVKLIESSIPNKAEIIRVFVGGDYAKEIQFKAWMQVAKNNPDMWFYGYTKSIPFWVKNKKLVPQNFMLTASIGSKFDDIIVDAKLRSAQVVGSYDEAVQLGLEIDTDDSHACLPKYRDESFGLLIHNKMTPGTWGSTAMKNLKK